MLTINENDVVDKLQPFSHTITNALEKLRDSGTSRTDVETIIERDISLSARILALANSALYRRSQEIKSVGQAIGVLGYNKLEEIVLAVQVIEGLANQLDKKDLQGFWLHSYMTAEFGRDMAPRCGLDPTISFYGGLFHDIGKLVLWVHFPEHYVLTRNYQKTHDCSFYSSEQNTISMNHSKIGGVVARNWNFPKAFVNIIENHHCNASNKIQDLEYSLLIKIADCVVRAFQQGDGRDSFVPCLDLESMNLLGLDMNDIVHGFEKLDHIKYEIPFFS